MYCQYIIAGSQRADVVGNIEILEDLSIGIFTSCGGAFVPRHVFRIVGIEPGNRNAVEVGDEAVFELHSQSQLINIYDVTNFKKDAGIYCLIVISHSADVETDKPGIVVTDAGDTSEPCRVVKRRRCPAQTERTIDWN